MPTLPTAAYETPLLGELERVIETLPGAPALGARIIGIEPRATATGYHPDAALEITVGTQRHHYAVEIKIRVDRKEILHQIKKQLRMLDGPGLLFTPYLTPKLADLCRELDLQFLDAAGNAYLRTPGLYMFIKGQKPVNGIAIATETQGGGTATALRIIFALLNNRDLRDAPYREIANAAGVALGAVGRVFTDLETRAYIARRKKGKHRRILEPARLLDEWVMNYPIRLRPKLNPRRFRGPTGDWWQQAHLENGTAWWGGEVAADRLTNYLKAETCTIYFDPVARTNALTQLIKEYRLRADPKGDVEVLDAFWKLPPDPGRPDIAPPMLVYADLVATHNPRNLEVADLIRERFVDEAPRTP